MSSSRLLPAFAVAAGSVPGREHLRLGRNAQDAFAWRAAGEALAAVVCDGCGSGQASEVGAQLGSQLTVAAMHRALAAGVAGDDPALLDVVRGDVLSHLGALLEGLGDGVASVERFFLFTVVGVLVTASHTLVFAAGDGCALINDQALTWGSAEENRPAYLGYGLVSATASPRLRRLALVPTEDVHQVLLGTDGLAEPGAPTVAELTSPSALVNPDGLRRRLAVAARAPAALPDDTTVLVVRRCASS